MIRQYLSLLFCFLTFMLSAKDGIEGRVLDHDTDDPLAGVSVILRGNDGKIKKYGASGSDGSFSIDHPTLKGATLSFSMIGYSKLTIQLDSAATPLTVRLQPADLKLKEVAVKADRIRENGDTVTYNVASFAQKQDKTIGDVLNRMPGIDVAENGKIQYQGTDINKFYIEGNDLLGGKYGLATNGIGHEDVGSVEVLENHQPMQVLRGLSFSDQAAINLKLKNGSKATLIAHGNAGGGFSWQPQGALWQGEIFTMMVKGNYQMLTTFKANNTGTSLNEQLSNFTFGDDGEDISGYIGLAVPSTYGLRSRRTLFNRSWVVSSSHLWKNSRGGEFKAQLDYINDRICRQSASTTTYFLESGDQVITEDKNSKSHTNALTGLFSYEANEKSYFINNTLNLNLSWNDLDLSTSGTNSNHQHAKTPDYDISNNLKVIKRFGEKHIVTFSSNNKWQSLPERLRITRDDREYGEKIGQYAFFTDERASYGFIINRVVVSLEGGLSGYIRKLSTDIWGDAISGDEGLETANDLTTDYFRFFVSPKFEFNRRKIELALKVPINFYSYFFSAGLNNRTELFAAPSLSIKWKITPRMSATVNGSARRSPASLHDIHPGVTLSDYRTMEAGIDDYYSSSGQSVSLQYQFRHPHNGIFVNASASYNWNKSKFGSSQTFIGDYILYSYRKSPSRTESMILMATANKTLDFMRGNIGLTAAYTNLSNEMTSQGSPVDYDSRSILLSPNINGNISSWLNWSYRFKFSRSSLKMSGLPSPDLDSYLHDISVSVTPGNNLTWTISGEYYRNEISASQYKDLMMADTKISYSISKRVEISASVNNLFDKRKYAYTTYGTLSAIEQSSRLRGREFLISIYLKK